MKGGLVFSRTLVLLWFCCYNMAMKYQLDRVRGITSNIELDRIFDEDATTEE